ncbi:tetratricopeptide repeat protein [Rhodosalinus sp.]|uniref:tetratricopeptide repeat protein n=1 Tax=Rhodosalinus sp. TaxID=2047741 RepID=UPI00397A73AC
MRAFLLTAFAATVSLAAPQSAPAEPVPSGDYLAARQAGYQSDFLSAARYFTRALAQDPSNPELLEAANAAYLALGQVDRALPVARRLIETAGPNQVANMALIAHYGATGRYEQLLGIVGDGNGVGLLVDGLVAGWSELGRGNMSEALAAFDEVGEERGLIGFALYHKALALASVGDFEGAEAIYASDTAGAMQMTRRGIIARVEVLSQIDRNDEALDLIRTAFGADLDPGLRRMRDALEAGETLPFTMVSGPRDGLAEVFFTISGALMNEASEDFTLLYARVAEHLRPDHIEALLMSADLLERLGQYELATETYKRVPRDDPSYHAAELGRADALRQAGKSDAAIEVLGQLAQTHGDLPAVHSSLGDLFRSLERFEEAVAAYDRAIALYDDPGEAQWFLYYARGIAYERQDLWPAAEADFRQALKLQPDQPQVLNYLGYSLVEKQENLEEALEMIERAVAARPDSGYIVDSLGWALYRLGRYEEAVGHMERAAELLPVDPIVNDHLGDVYWAVGRRMEARFQWQRALSFDPEPDDAERIRRKLEVGLDTVLAEEGAPPLELADGPRDEDG